jgi:hypothetical protein
MTCLGGTWEYRLRTRVYWIYSYFDSNDVLVSKTLMGGSVATPAISYSCK